MKKLFILFGFIAVFFTLSTIDANAQKKQRIGLPEGADSMQVKGKISGGQFIEYEIFVGKDDEWSVNLKSVNQFIGYTVKDASGDKYDFLEKAPVEGFYKIKVYLNSTGAKSKKIASFTLDIKFVLESGEPIS